MAEPYDANSPNAMFSRIIQRLDAQDRESHTHREEVRSLLGKIETQTTLTNGRVTKIEGWILTVKAKVAAAAFVVSAIVSLAVWIIERLLK